MRYGPSNYWGNASTKSVLVTSTYNKAKLVLVQLGGNAKQQLHILSQALVCTM